MKKTWIKIKDSFFYEEHPIQMENLPIGVYELNFDEFKGVFYLKKILEKFEIPNSIYKFNQPFIDRCINTYNKLDKNFGILLKGIKGGGKTIIAKKIANDLNVPIILINNSYSNLSSFIGAIHQDLVLFFDEFEKVYNIHYYESSSNGIGHLLTLMDGVFNSKYKRLFIFTSNEKFIPNALESRPSRIRYIKDFTDLDMEAIDEILNETLTDKTLIPKIKQLLTNSDNITVDLVKEIAIECNIYGYVDENLFKEFNISRNNRVSYHLFEINNNSLNLISKDFCRIEDIYIGKIFNINSERWIVTDINYLAFEFKAKNLKEIEKSFLIKEEKYMHY